MRIEHSCPLYAPNVDPIIRRFHSHTLSEIVNHVQGYLYAIPARRESAPVGPCPGEPRTQGDRRNGDGTCHPCPGVPRTHGDRGDTVTAPCRQPS